MCIHYVGCALFSIYGGQSADLARSTVVRYSSSIPSFRSSDIEIIECPEDRRHPKPDSNELIFGAHFSDHMFEVRKTVFLALASKR